jgi:hypothetical protein
LQLVGQPFDGLRELDASIANDALPLLVAAVPNVVDLKLFFYKHGRFTTRTAAPATQEAQPTPPAFIALSSLHALRRLSLVFPDGTTMTRADVAVLDQLTPLLRELSFWLGVADFTDAHFAALLARLPHLTVLRFKVVGQLTAAAFRIADEACRELRELSLTCKCYLWALEGARVHPLFPQLRKLSSADPQDGRWYWEESDWK